MCGMKFPALFGHLVFCIELRPHFCGGLAAGMSVNRVCAVPKEAGIGIGFPKTGETHVVS